MIPSRWLEACLGAIAGVVSGMVAAVVLLGQGHLDGSQPLLLAAPDVGWLALLVVSAVGGALYGGIYRYQPGEMATAMSSGLLFGVLWWVVVWLTVVPIAGGTELGWSIADAAAAFPLLVASIIAGGLQALLFRALGSIVVGSRAETRFMTATGTPITHRIVILGGGFGGVATARRLEQLLTRRPEVAVTLVSDSNYLLFTPMLAEVASGSLSPRHVASPLRASCPRTQVRRAMVERVDVEARTAIISTGTNSSEEMIPYDQLVLAVGVVPALQRLPGVAASTMTLKSLTDATDLRDRVLELLDMAESEERPDERRRLLTIAVAGGGFAGAELVAEMHDLVQDVLHYHPRIDPSEPRLVLIHSRERILPELSPELGDYALQQLRERGIEFRLGVRVVEASESGVTLSDGTGIATATFVWTAGNEPAGLVRRLAADHGLAALETDATLRVRGIDRVWAVGDCARIPDVEREGAVCPPTAQHAIRQGKQAAENLVATLDGRPLRPFRFRALGMLVVLGHNTAAAEIRGYRFSGLFAWFLWRGIYLAKMPGLEKRLRIFLDWLLDLVFPRDIVVARTADSAGDGTYHRPSAPDDVAT